MQPNKKAKVSEVAPEVPTNFIQLNGHEKGEIRKLARR